MTRHSPHTVQYHDLVVFAAEMMAACQARYDGARARGTSNLNALTHQLEVARTLHRLLKKGEPVKQTDLFSLFQAVK